MNRANSIFAAAMMLVIVAAVIAVNRLPGGELVLRNAETGTEYARYPLEPGMEFSVTFIHSVNKSPYTDYYVVEEENGIIMTGARYFSYGAGVETQTSPEQMLEFCDDGSIFVSGEKVPMRQLIYFVGKLSDHVLGINGEKYSLTLICGQNEAVEFSYE